MIRPQGQAPLLISDIYQCVRENYLQDMIAAKLASPPSSVARPPGGRAAGRPADNSAGQAAGWPRDQAARQPGRQVASQLGESAVGPA